MSSSYIQPIHYSQSGLSRALLFLLHSKNIHGTIQSQSHGTIQSQSQIHSRPSSPESVQSYTSHESNDSVGSIHTPTLEAKCPTVTTNTPSLLKSRPYACRVPGCGKTFRDSSTRTRHEKVHNPKRFPCAHCGLEYSRKDNRNRHQDKCKGVKSKRFKHSVKPPRSPSTLLRSPLASLSFAPPTHLKLNLPAQPFKDEIKKLPKRKRAYMRNGILYTLNSNALGL